VGVDVLGEHAVVKQIEFTTALDPAQVGHGARAGRLVLVPLLVLVALLVLPLADVLFRGVHRSVDLLVVLVVGLALGELRRLVDPLAGLFRVLLDVVLRLFARFSNSLTPFSCVSAGLACALPRCVRPTLICGTDALAASGYSRRVAVGRRSTRGRHTLRRCERISSDNNKINHHMAMIL
jgi:hypothetical protein